MLRPHVHDVLAQIAHVQLVVVAKGSLAPPFLDFFALAATVLRDHGDAALSFALVLSSFAFCFASASASCAAACVAFDALASALRCTILANIAFLSSPITLHATICF